MTENPQTKPPHFPKINKKNWKKLCEYNRTTNKNYKKNFTNFENIPLQNWIILKPKTHHFFSIYSQKKTSRIGVSDHEKTKKTDSVETDFLTIYPGKIQMNMGEEEFFEKILDSPDFVLPCGKIHVRMVRLFKKFDKLRKFLGQSSFVVFCFCC